MCRCHRIIVTLILACGLYNSRVLAQTTSVDRELLANIAIMETVLDRLLFPDRSQFRFMDGGTQGYYLMNYGVIFNVRTSLLTNRILAQKTLKKLYELHENKLVYIETSDTDKTQSDDFSKEVARLKNSIVRFMGSWTSAVIHLTSSARVSVIVDFDHFLPQIAGEPDRWVKGLIASVSIADIIDYRKGRLTDDEFARKVIFQEQQFMDEDVTILSNVIKTSLEEPGNQLQWGIAGEVRGIYFKGYGVVFFADVIPGRSVTAAYYQKYLDRLKDRSVTIPGRDLAFKDDEFKKDLLEQKLIQLISNYGFNMRDLAADEWFEVAINYKGTPIDGQYSRIIFKVQKRAIDDYQRERIRFDQFKKLVQVVYY